MAMVDIVEVPNNIEINGVVLEKGSYQTKDLYIIDPSEGMFAYFANDYLIEDKKLFLRVDDFMLSKVPQKYHERFKLNPNGIIHLIPNGNFFRDYRLVLKDGIITKLYRADSVEEVALYPEEIRKNYDAEWK